MTDTDTHATPESQAGSFHAEGRTVDPGRGWDWIVEAFALFRKQPGIWIMTTVVPGVLFAVISMVSVLGSFAIALLFPIFVGGLMFGCKALDRGGALEIEHLFAGFRRKTRDLVVVGALNLVGLVVITFAFVAVAGVDVLTAVMDGDVEGAGLFIESLLIAMLLAAGLSVPLFMVTWFAPALIVLHDMAPGAALKASFYACLRNWIPFLVYGVVLLVLCVVAAIPAGLGFLVLIPVLVASVFTAYRDIFCAG
jgi:uncharacterized membrane protein